jgi:hypothetical protein
MLANGFAMPPFAAPSCVPFELPAKGLSFGKETPPSPALCKATFVAIVSKKPMAVVTPVNKAVLEGYLLCWLRDGVTVGGLEKRGLRRGDRWSDVPTRLQEGCTFVATRAFGLCRS